MAIWVKIRKILEKNGKIYYEVFKQDYENIEFYMGIDKDDQLLLFFLDKDFNIPVKIVDYKKQDEIIYPLEKIPNISFSHALIRGLKVLKNNEFPEVLDYAA